MPLIERDPANPILAPIEDLTWASKKIYNAAITKDDGIFRMVFRGVGDDWTSRLGYAVSVDGVTFEVDPEPVLSPGFSWDAKGCEDPRVTTVEGTVHIVYTAWDGRSACLAVAETDDWHTFVDRRLMLPNWRLGYWQKLVKGPRGWSKAGALFPDRRRGRFAMLFGDSDIWYADSDDFRSWTGRPQPVLSPRKGYFDAGYIEMGPPPIRTDHGWLILYHGVDKRDDTPGGFRTYRLGAALVDLDKPWQVSWRCKTPLLEPVTPYETIGLIDVMPGGFEELQNMTHRDLEERAELGMLASSVFCCGAIETNGQVSIYYSGSDTVMCLANTTVQEILDT